jgi:hypothetical protein
VIPLSPLDIAARGLSAHLAFMYARDLNAAMLQHALAAGLGRYYVIVTHFEPSRKLNGIP